MRKWATVVFALAGIVALVYAVSGDPCDLPDVWPILVAVAMLSGGVVAFSLVEERTRPMWIPISAAIVGGVAVGAGAWIAAVVRWAEHCSA